MSLRVVASSPQAPDRPPGLTRTHQLEHELGLRRFTRRLGGCRLGLICVTRYTFSVRRSSLRRISLLLVLAFTALASADVVCAWPCLIDASTPASKSQSATSHSCHSVVEQSGVPAVAGASDTCGMEHADSGPVAERITVRKSLQFDVAVPVADSLGAPRFPRAGVLSLGQAGTASIDPPGSFTPLRI